MAAMVVRGLNIEIASQRAGILSKNDNMLSEMYEMYTCVRYFYFFASMTCYH